LRIEEAAERGGAMEEDAEGMDRLNMGVLLREPSRADTSQTYL
jgi:hypothetical protein